VALWKWNESIIVLVQENIWQRTALHKESELQMNFPDRCQTAATAAVYRTYVLFKQMKLLSLAARFA
jgi:hypothetical protein